MLKQFYTFNKDTRYQILTIAILTQMCRGKLPANTILQIEKDSPYITSQHFALGIDMGKTLTVEEIWKIEDEYT